MVRVRVLGALEATVDGDGSEVVADLGGPRQRAVLALLLVGRGEVVSVDRLVEDLWNSEPPPRAIGALQAYVSHLRKALEPGRAPRTPATVLVSEPPGYAVRLPADAVDAWRFEAMVRAAAATDNPEDARTILEQALALWRGPAYAEAAGEPWAVAEAARLEGLRLVARERWCAAVLRTGAAADAVLAAEVLTREHPLREEGWRLLALALYASGRQSDALGALRRAREILAEEMGLDPGPVLAQLESDVLNQQLIIERAPLATATPGPVVGPDLTGPALTVPVATAQIPTVPVGTVPVGTVPLATVPAVTVPAGSTGTSTASGTRTSPTGASTPDPPAPTGPPSDGEAPAGPLRTGSLRAGSLPAGSVVLPGPCLPGHLPAGSLPAGSAMTDPAPARTPGRPPTGGEFVGRDAELNALHAAAGEAVEHSALRVALLAGDPGAGKTTILDRLSRDLGRLGWRVAVGRCPEAAGAPPAWAWVETLRILTARRRPRSADAGVGAAARRTDRHRSTIGRLLRPIPVAAGGGRLPDDGRAPATTGDRAGRPAPRGHRNTRAARRSRRHGDGCAVADHRLLPAVRGRWRASRHAGRAGGAGAGPVVARRARARAVRPADPHCGRGAAGRGDAGRDHRPHRRKPVLPGRERAAAGQRGHLGGDLPGTRRRPGRAAPAACPAARGVGVGAATGRGDRPGRGRGRVGAGRRGRRGDRDRRARGRRAGRAADRTGARVGAVRTRPGP